MKRGSGETALTRPGTRLLFLVAGGEGVASSRYRVFQYLPFLEEAGFSCDVWSVEGGIANRLRLFSKLGDHDLTVIQKHLFQPWELFWIRKRSRRLIYDLDDAVMYRPTGARSHDSATRRTRFRQTVKCCDWVIAGNACLQTEVRKYQPRVSVIPTVLDTRRYAPKADHGETDTVILGWIGSRSNLGFLEGIVPALERLHARHPHVRLKVVADAGIRAGKIPAIEKRWAMQDEQADLRSFDIGIMPLPDDVWTRGKCGFKIVQYMAAGLPVVCSPVGVNSEIVEDGVHGFLANTPDEWTEKISRLVEHPPLRAQMGAAGRNRVEQSYSLERSAPGLVDLLNGVHRDGASHR